MTDLAVGYSSQPSVLIQVYVGIGALFFSKTEAMSDIFVPLLSPQQEQLSSPVPPTLKS